MTSDIYRGHRRTFALPTERILRRADVKYAALTNEVAKTLANTKYPLNLLGSSTIQVQYGSSSLASVDPVGVPILRMNNVSDFGLDLTDLKYVNLDAAELARYRLNRGDLLFNRTNAEGLVGKCAVFREQGDWIFASYLIRIRLDESLDPDFVCAYLNSEPGRLQLDRLSRPIAGMSNINAQELKSVQVPKPPKRVQEKMASRVQQALGQAQGLLSDASDLISARNDLPLEKANIKFTRSDRLTYAVKAADAVAAGRLNAEYFHPDRRGAVVAVQAGNAAPVSLDSLVDVIREPAVVAEADMYIGLADVEARSGELTIGETERAAVGLRVKEGDVLLSRLRPNLNKVYVVEEDAICSTEWLVLRRKSEINLDVEYLAAFLRSDAVVAQTERLVTGNTHPRMSPNDLSIVCVAVPTELKDQRAATTEANKVRDEFRKRRCTARAMVQKAQAQFASSLY